MKLMHINLLNLHRNYKSKVISKSNPPNISTKTPLHLIQPISTREEKKKKETTKS